MHKLQKTSVFGCQRRQYPMDKTTGSKLPLNVGNFMLFYTIWALRQIVTGAALYFDTEHCLVLKYGML